MTDVLKEHPGAAEVLETVRLYGVTRPSVGPGGNSMAHRGLTAALRNAGFVERDTLGAWSVTAAGRAALARYKAWHDVQPLPNPPKPPRRRVRTVYEPSAGPMFQKKKRVSLCCPTCGNKIATV